IGITLQGQSLLVSDFLDGFYAVDLATGNRTKPSLGTTGPLPSSPLDIETNTRGQVLLAMQSSGGGTRTLPQGVAVWDPTTNLFSLLSGPGVGTGPNITSNGPTGIAVEANGTVLLSDQTLGVIFSIDPATGKRTILSDATHGLGPTFSAPQDVMVITSVPEPSSMLLAVLAG